MIREEHVNILLSKGEQQHWSDRLGAGRCYMVSADMEKAIKAGVDKWNEEHPDDQAKLSEPQYAGTTSEKRWF